MTSPRLILLVATLSAGLAVAAGAFASHALRGQISDRALEIFQTGATYQIYHALALLFIALWLSRTETATNWIIAATWAFIAGIVLFSGSLYALSLTGIKNLGIITPLGGVAFLGGWLSLAIAAWYSNSGLE
ncbi:MAG: DUF423 domain-containing protein [Jaaginema sp. PMC 1079.18]|nr:DUF423 domain-containing protein [Jaaginema sp. PMC 1080.18]MEC4850339.1 DUF423 domain-containing protein [Jaaginema sp. PMC 1079.18]MEC4865592.1 DUF423 domain-containing protein [Jaaginema sp. PMC 1078.18]